MPPANFVVASAMAEAVFTMMEMRKRTLKACPVRFRWKYPKKPKQRTPEEEQERERDKRLKKSQATVNSLNLAPLHVFADAEIQEKLKEFEKKTKTRKS